MRVSKIMNNKSLQKKIFPHLSTEFKTINPTNNKFLKEFETFSPEKIENVLESSLKAYESWRKVPLKDRLKKMEKLIDKFEAHKDELGKLITLESVLLIFNYRVKPLQIPKEK